MARECLFNKKWLVFSLISRVKFVRIRENNPSFTIRQCDSQTVALALCFPTTAFSNRPPSAYDESRTFMLHDTGTQTHRRLCKRLEIALFRFVVDENDFSTRVQRLSRSDYLPIKCFLEPQRRLQTTYYVI